MTRKRKIDAIADDSNVDKNNTLAGNGYQSFFGKGSASTTDFPNRTFPRKENFRERGDPMSDTGCYKRGYSWNNERNGMVQESCSQEEKESYPTELVAYLKNIEQLKLSEGRLENVIMDKCAEECLGEEAKLLTFRDSCVAVESVFGSSQHGASLFLSGLGRLKHKRLLDLFFTGPSARAIETLLFALQPISSSQQVQLIEKFAELLCDNWSVAVNNQHSSFLIRCLVRITCGLQKKRSEKESLVLRPKTKDMEDVITPLLHVFERVASQALDSSLSSNAESLHQSLVVQDVLEADSKANLGKTAALLQKILANAYEKGESIRQLWQGKNSSRIWEKMVVASNEETLRSLWELVIADHVSELANHPCANFPLQKFIASVRSLELATNVCHEATPLLSTFLSRSRWGVAEALLRCASRHEELQEPLLKELRRYFKADKASTKLNFFSNIITLNSYNGTTLKMESCDLHGCLLMEVLLSFKKIKTVKACLEALSAEEIVQLAKNNRTSHVLQAAFESFTLDDDVKEKLIAVFENDWASLISDVYGSHVFEKIWDSSLFNVKRRQDLMKKLVPIHSDSKFWKFAMLRCDMYLFRKDRKAWVEKMKNSVKTAKG